MPKARNVKKGTIISDIEEDILSQVEIASKHGVTQAYISQLNKELINKKYFDLLKNLYNIMNTKMKFKERPSDNDKEIVKEVQSLL
ncbi:hypothetical protein LCGC14_0741830 [marine sediment metagenome]|uniref:HTH cro/C1-type domain-containing protein n=1 Tax=marine sediment metagenome TaxID=412755 RepID=A0A0F9QAQ7_9ZZZZ